MTGFGGILPSSSTIFLIQWSVATALGWLFAHPLLQRYVLEASWIFLTVGVPLVALGTLALALVRWHRGAERRWWSIVTNTCWAIVILLSVVICQAGSLAGVLQWFVLRQYLSRSIHWMLASWLGALLTLQISDILVASDIVYLGVEGTLLGMMQWFVLRREVAGAGWWMPASVLGWLLGGLVFFPGWTSWDGVDNILSEHMALIVSHSIPRALGGLVCGTVTGAALLILLKKRRVAV